MSSADFGTIIQIGDILVSEDVVCECFACDYERCGGICCIEGDSGAPLEESELEPLESNYPEYKKFMSEKGCAAAEASGFFELDREGDLVTPCVPGSQECAYCHLQTKEGKTSALCAIELAGLQKPASCALYPIRVTRMPGGGLALNLHRWKICECAFEKGKKEGTPAYRFLRGPLEKHFGKDFYAALDAAAQHLRVSE